MASAGRILTTYLILFIFISEAKLHCVCRYPGNWQRHCTCRQNSDHIYNAVYILIQGQTPMCLSYQLTAQCRQQAGFYWHIYYCLYSYKRPNFIVSAHTIANDSTVAPAVRILATHLALFILSYKAKLHCVCRYPSNWQCHGTRWQDSGHIFSAVYIHIRGQTSSFSSIS